ncbi:MAG: hypothetical protein IKB04_09240 [Clostridia bacterium]|nr:hypothetical protein [Clostridia bacterium]MBR2407202.1 hypothetical protein [Clostridia bacterium]
MSLRDDLINISNNVSAVLDGCNGVLRRPVATLTEVPPCIEETRDASYHEGEQAGHSIGYDLGYGNAQDAWWDIITNHGQPTSYSNLFRLSRLWNDETFTPTYPLVPTSMYMTFYGNRSLSRLPVEFDGSQCTDWNYAFCSSGFTELPVVDMRGAPSTTKQQSVFYGMPYLTRIEKVYLHGGNVGDSFQNIPNLVEIRLEGELVSSVDVSQSTLLSRESIASLVAALSDTVADKTLTLSYAAVEAAFAPEEWGAQVATKPNWTFTLT